MAQELSRSVKIYLDNSDVVKKTEDVKSKIGELEKSMSDLRDEGKKDTAEYARKEKQLAKLNIQQTRYAEQIEKTKETLTNLTNATERELTTVYYKLQTQLKNTKVGTEQYNTALEHSIRVEQQLAQVKNARLGIAKTEPTILAKSTMASKAAAGATTALSSANMVLGGAFSGVVQKLKALRVALMSNPWTLIATAVLAAVAALYKWVQTLGQATEAEKAMQNVREKTAEQFDAEDNKLQRLIATLNNSSLAYEMRKDALDEIKKIVPGYHASLTAEGDLINNNTDALEHYTQMLKYNIGIKSIYEEIDALNKKKRELKKEYDEDLKAWTSKSVSFKQIGINLKQIFHVGKNPIDKYYDSVEEVDEAIKQLNQNAQSLQQNMSELIKANPDKGTNDGNGNGSNNTKEETSKTKLAQSLQNIELSHQNKLFEIKQKYRNGEITSNAEYQKQIQVQEQAALLIREQLLEQFYAKETDPKQKQEILKQIQALNTSKIDQEIKFQEAVSLLIKQNNPLIAEQEAHEQRLQQYGIFGIKQEQLTKEQLQALEILERQHAINISKIQADEEKRRREELENKLHKDFDPAKKQGEQDIKQKEADLSFADKMGTQSPADKFQSELQLHKMKMDLIREEIKQREQLGLSTEDQNAKLAELENKLTEKYIAEYQRRTQEYSQYSQSLGNALGDVLSGQENALKAFGDVIIDIMFDTLSSIINAKIAEASAVVVAEQAKATAIAMAQPDSVLTFGASGIARAAVMTALIGGVLTAAKSALKGMLKKKSSNTTATINGEMGKGEIVINQRAKGKYDVLGNDDGKLYRNVPLAGMASTGIVATPTLMGEQGAELVVSHKDFIQLQKHINYPLILEAIQQSRTGRVPQRATGKYDALKPTTTNGATQNSPDISNVLNSLTSAIEALNKKQLEINYYQFENAKQTVDNARSRSRR